MNIRLPSLSASAAASSTEGAAGSLLVVGAFTADKKLALTPSAADIDIALDNMITSRFERGMFEAKVGEILFLEESEDFRDGVAVLGLGDIEHYDAEAFRSSLNKSVNVLSKWSDCIAFTAGEWIPGETEERNAALIFSSTILNTLTKRVTMKTDEEIQEKNIKILWIDENVSDNIVKGLADGSQCAEAMVIMRHLADLPGNVCTPEYLGNFVTQAGETVEGLETIVMDETAIREAGMGALLSVSQGSVVPPRFIVMRWNGGKTGEAPVALVGKGITFDAGGISIKPAANMADMTYDMSGAACVIGTVIAAAKAGLKKNILGVVASCENLPSGSAAKPGDVVTSLSGKTIEILNTDCEGRMVLADALAWAARENPSVMIDMATLTGACCIALGAPYSGLFSTDKMLAEKLIAAGKRTLDEVWPLPVGPAYKKLMRSTVADIANQATTREGGASSAAAFLSVFTNGLPWAHLDIAATANTSGRDRTSTGRPATLLTSFLIED